MTSTNEYLAQAIQSERNLLYRNLRALIPVVKLLAEDYDPCQGIDDQSGHVIEAMGDLVKLSTEVEYRSVLLSGLEDVPRVG